MGNVSNKSSREKHFTVSSFPLETVSKNMVEPERPQMNNGGSLRGG